MGYKLIAMDLDGTLNIETTEDYLLDAIPDVDKILLRKIYTFSPLETSFGYRKLQLSLV